MKSFYCVRIGKLIVGIGIHYWELGDYVYIRKTKIRPDPRSAV